MESHAYQIWQGRKDARKRVEEIRLAPNTGKDDVEFLLKEIDSLQSWLNTVHRYLSSHNPDSAKKMMVEFGLTTENEN